MPLAGKYPLGYNRLGLNSFLRSSNFDARLSALADQKAKARFLARLLSATLGISAIANPSAKAFPRCVFMSERGIEFITRGPDLPFMFCWLAV
jgi:hypothetical protein